MPVDILIYQTVSGRVPFKEWLDGLGDFPGRLAVQRRLDRIAAGNLGDHMPCRDGVWELRVDRGPGYRVYFGRASGTVVILLAGGDKRSQDSDISRAVRFWHDYKDRSS